MSDPARGLRMLSTRIPEPHVGCLDGLAGVRAADGRRTTTGSDADSHQSTIVALRVSFGTLAQATDYSPAVSPVDPEELAATIGARLGGDGWTVNGHPSTPPRFTFVLAHPLT